MSLTDLHPTAAMVAAGVATAAVGALAGGRLVERGLAQLAVTTPRFARVAGRIACALGGIAAVFATRHAGNWWLLPAMLVWAYGLAAAATCDALTQRVPIPLVRLAAVATAVAVLGAAAANLHWRWAAFAAISAAAAGIIFTFCWRTLRAGFGDVRLAVLGGVGLTNPTHLGLVAALASFVVITLSQAGVTLSRGGNRHTTFPYGPAIAVAFLVAAVV